MLCAYAPDDETLTNNMQGSCVLITSHSQTKLQQTRAVIHSVPNIAVHYKGKASLIHV